MDKVEKSLDQWREELSPERFHVCRMRGTEIPFGGRWLLNDRPGRYVCGCCGRVLFLSGQKYDSGTGWPSFWDVAESGAVDVRADYSHGKTRTEAVCARCDAHLGHVFQDGPPPTGRRWCINSVCLDFEPDVIEPDVIEPDVIEPEDAGQDT